MTTCVHGNSTDEPCAKCDAEWLQHLLRNPRAVDTSNSVVLSLEDAKIIAGRLHTSFLNAKEHRAKDNLIAAIGNMLPTEGG